MMRRSKRLVLNEKYRYGLCNMDPFGLGTCNAEGIDSYYERLAEFHGVSPYLLYKNVLAPALGLAREPRFSPLSFHLRSCLLGAELKAREFANVLNFVTGRDDLHLCSLIKLGEMVGVIGAINPQKRYCPLCYAADQSVEGLKCAPLLWRVGIVNACPIHNVRLRVWRCERPSVGRRRVSLPWVCWQCGSEFMGCQEGVLEMATPVESAVAQQVGELISFSTAGLRFNADYMENLNSIYHAHLGRGRAHTISALLPGCSSAHVYDLFRGRRRATLKMLIKLCSAVRISLSRLLMGELEEFDWNSDGNDVFGENRTDELRAVSELLQSAISLKNYGLAAEICKEMRINMGDAYRCFPEQAQALCIAYHAIKIEEKQIRANDIAKQIEDYREQLSAQGLELSLANISRALGDRIHFRSELGQAVLASDRTTGITKIVKK
jgi:hypothetical protein